MSTELNIEALTVLADHIEKVDASRFGMSGWINDRIEGGPVDESRTVENLRHDCGTAACIGGWSEILFAPSSFHPMGDGADVFDARVYLGLTPAQWRGLTMPPGFWNENYTQAEAVATIRNLIATGEVKWPAR